MHAREAWGSTKEELKTATPPARPMKIPVNSFIMRSLSVNLNFLPYAGNFAGCPIFTLKSDGKNDLSPSGCARASA
jgi:hypothetical protein